MSRLRMASGMAAAFADAASGPATAVCGFVRTVVCGAAGGLWSAAKAVGRACRVVLPWLLLTAIAVSLSYLGYRVMCNWVTQTRTAAEATRHETAFNESLDAAVESADDLEINARVRAMVGSRLGHSGGAVHGSDGWRELFSSLEGVPAEKMEYRVLMARGPPAGHTVRLMVMRSAETGREYVSVEVDGQQAYLCVVEDGEGLWPWVYRGVGLWEHLLDKVEAYVDRDRQRQEIDSRFGNLEEGK